MIPGTQGWFTIQESVDVIHHDAINGKKAHDPLNDEGKFCEPFTMETKLIEIKTDGNFPNLIPSARGRPAADRPERRRAEGTLGRGARPVLLLCWASGWRRQASRAESSQSVRLQANASARSRRSSFTGCDDVQRTPASRDSAVDSPGQHLSQEAKVTPAVRGGEHGPSMSLDEKGALPRGLPPGNARAQTDHEEGQTSPNGGTVYRVPTQHRSQLSRSPQTRTV